jgi:TolB-like protein/Flp pilus assembly protein TadD
MQLSAFTASLGHFIAELQRRKVLRVAATYLVGAWVVLQVAVALQTAWALSAAFSGTILNLLIIAFPVAVGLAWFFEVTPDGIKRTSVSGDGTIAKLQRTDFVLAGALALVFCIGAVQLFWPREAPVGGTETAAADAAKPKGEPGAPDLPVAAKPPEGSVAVLPFTNLTGKDDDIAFAAGLHDDLLTRLAKIAAMRVIARTSVLRYANTTKTISDIAKDLGVAAVLEGSVQRAGNRVRIGVKLIDAATDAQKWGETYDRTLTADNLFDIQREITEAIAAALNTLLTAQELKATFAGGTRNLEAYERYARGRLLLRSADRATRDRFQEAIAAFDQAIALDPNFATAYALKGYALTYLFWTGQRLETKYRDAAKIALDRAAELAPDAAETQFALASYFYWGFLDYPQALQHVDRALEAAPNSALAWQTKGAITRRDGRFAESVDAFSRATLLDPQNPGPMSELAYLLGNIGEFARAETLFARARAIDPTSSYIKLLIASVRNCQGDAAGSWREYKYVRTYLPSARVAYAIITRDPANVKFALEDWPAGDRRPESFPDAYEVSRASALLALGKADEARRILLEVKARLDASANPYPDAWNANALVTPADVPGMLGDLAGVRAAERDYLANAPRDEFAKNDILQSLSIAFLRAGDRDRAVHYLEQAEKIFGPSFYLRVSIDPAFDPLHDHVQYQALKTRYEAWAAEQTKGAGK